MNSINNHFYIILCNYLDLYGTEEARKIILYQYKAFSENCAPTIADYRIKAINIIENNEQIIDLVNSLHPRISLLSDEENILLHDSINDIDQRSSSCGKVRLSVYTALKKMIEEIDRISEFFGYEKGSIDIKLFEGLRDIETQKYLFDEMFKKIKEQNPLLSDEEVYKQTSTWVSPYKDNIPTHSTGAAIDFALYDSKNKKFIRMGRFNKPSNNTGTFEIEGLSDEEILNRILFLIAATNAGLVNYIYEFWHYSYNDRYALWCKKSQEASPYGAI
jgi:D-alanyl-D-alanine dipeptidase